MVTILDEAAALTSSDRPSSYGHPRDNLGQTAALVTAYLRGKLRPDAALDARDVAWLMVLVKASRDSFSRKRDNLVDGAGWLRCAERAEEKP
jgi:hypothetical protein